MEIFLSFNLVYPCFPRIIQKVYPTLSQALNSDVVESSEFQLYYFPALVPIVPDKYSLLWTPVCDETLTQYQRQYTFQSVPVDFLDQYIVRLMEFSDEVLVYWKNGLLGRQRDDYFLIIYKPENRLLSVSVRGPKPLPTFVTCIEISDLIYSQTITVDDLELDVKESVPCTHCLRLSRTPWIFSVSQLELHITTEPSQDGKWFVSCGQSNTPVDVATLVPDVLLSHINASLMDYENLEMYQEIGTGAFGTIFQGYLNSAVVAIKVLNSIVKVDPSSFKEFRHELHIMSLFNHKNLVQLKGFSLDPMAIVMEFVPMGNLYQFVNDPNSARDWAIVLKIAIDVASGLNYMHSLTPLIVHRDLKSPNVLLYDLNPNAPVCAKITDFGTSTRMFNPKLRELGSSNRVVMNPTWLAPEVMSDHIYTEKSDIYSLGIIMWELIARCHPFSEYGFEFMFELEDAIQAGKRPSFPTWCPDIYLELVKDCWQPSLSQRPDCFSIIESIVNMTPLLAPRLVIPQNILFTIYHESKTYPPLPEIPAPAPVPLPIPMPEIITKNYSRLDLTASAAASVRKYNPEKGRCVVTRKQIGSKVYSMLVLRNRQVWIGTKEGSISVWNTANGEEMARLTGIHKSGIDGLIKVGDHLWTQATVEGHSQIKVWRTISPNENLKDQIKITKSIVKSGYLNLHGNSKIKRRWVELYASGHIIIRKQEISRTPKEIISLRGAKIESKASKLKKFTIRNSLYMETEGTWILEPNSQELGQQWVDLIQKLINEPEDPLMEIQLVHQFESVGISTFELIGDNVWEGGQDLKLRVINPTTFETIKEPYLREQFILKLQLTNPSSTELLVTKFLYHEDYIWIAVTKNIVVLDKNANMVATLSGHLHRIVDMIGDDNKVWTCSDDGTIRIWSFGDSFTCLHTLNIHQGKIYTLMKMDNCIWSAGFSMVVDIWDRNDYRSLHCGTDHKDCIIVLRKCRNMIWAGSWDCSISIYS